MRALRVFLITFVSIAVGGVVLIMATASGGDFDPAVHGNFTGMRAMIFGTIAYFIASIPLAILAARHRNVLEWAAGYAGAVLGIVPFLVLYLLLSGWTCGSGDSCSTLDLGFELVRAAVFGLVVLTMPASLVYLVVGGLRASSRP